jgi:hypothetical protein
MSSYKGTKFNYFKIKVLESLNTEIKVINNTIPDWETIVKKYKLLKQP